MRQELICGDSLVVLPTLDADSVDAVVTDPPYEMGIVGKAWDSTGIAFRTDVWREALRVAKPGAHLLAFGSTRTVHRIAVAIEDAGWEIRDTLVWAYAQGMPKTGDLSIDVDAAMGVKRAVVGERTVSNVNLGNRDMMGDEDGTRQGAIPVLSGPVTDEAKRAAGWSTGLKPAWEPIVMARKPFRGSVARNFMAHGTGALNIDATRLPIDPDDPMRDAIYTSKPGVMAEHGHLTVMSEDGVRRAAMSNEEGRWPANVVLTDDVFDWDHPDVVGGGPRRTPGNRQPVVRGPHEGADPAYDSMGSTGVMVPRNEPAIAAYSRFFLVPKASRSDREPDHDALLQLGVSPIRGNRGDAGALNTPKNASRCLACGSRQPWTRQCARCGAAELEDYIPNDERKRVNTHPTVKPRELIRHLVRMVTPPGGTVLDPFAGSGTMGKVADEEGFGWIMVEMDPAHVAIARTRLLGAQRGLGI